MAREWKKKWKSKQDSFMVWIIVGNMRYAFRFLR